MTSELSSDQKLGVLVRLLRGEKSQAKFADEVDLTQPQVSRYERAENSPDLGRLTTYARETGYDLVLKLEPSKDPGNLVVEWPTPENIPEEYEEIVQKIRTLPPRERHGLCVLLYELLEGDRDEVPDLEVDRSEVSALYDDAREVLDRLFDIEADAGNKDLASSIMQAKRILPE